jgi:uncharacterized protein
VVVRADFAVAQAGKNPGKNPDVTSAGGAAANGHPNRYDGSPAEAVSTTEAAGGRTITIIDGTNGKRHDVVIPLGGVDGKPAGGSDQGVSELSPNGPLPRIAADGTRPAQVYAQPAKAIAGKSDAPKIAIVVGGLGIGGAATADALGKLPGAVTLAFPPYGGGLDQLAVRARNDGHELLLQVPMEPFDYPDNDPGPQTLLTSLDPGQNIDRLQWLLSRFQGYVGIANFMGARFTSSESALAPVLREIARRGLLYLDDGSSQRSLASQVAGATNLAFAKADLSIDAVPTPAEVERALGRLETIARERGMAVGMTSAVPVAIERIAIWAKAAEARGILLVPISAIAVQRDEARLTQVR